MHIAVNTKFDVGQEVSLIKKERKIIEKKQSCKICNGAGHIIYSGYTLCCPECNGDKYICIDSQIIDNYSTDKKPHTITSIGIKITANGSKLTYVIDGKPYERKRLVKMNYLPHRRRHGHNVKN